MYAATIFGSVCGVATVICRIGNRLADRWRNVRFFQILYNIYSNGVIELNASYRPNISNLLRIGMAMTFPKEFSHVEYYARGPWENYTDRLTGSFLGRYITTFEDMFEPYPKPQGMGNREDLRELILVNPQTGVQDVLNNILSYTFVSNGVVLSCRGNIESGTKFHIYNMGGVKLATKEADNSTSSLDVVTEKLPRGSYLVVVENTTGCKSYKVLF